ncbi:NADPH-dependent 2,4-dienoyl-CoA reductase/sulfur reductase-like enzyme/rhodanese-related sulfurtransferase [Enterococcus sp. PF1-24]|uniref:FAD-dependent oxidoreductase n=1 Tax=unclassified Enterococcus TaxID=2608891 RepID=UPI0024762305|nr:MULTISPECIES: FAD-dependent oxidoreductase [unclassified Enterococcus]MDH6365167.1 NADPH-dependent 2,4-dienoyl-CoA reductase/sulfur reductase-like enzyme/rhodanese-related sulfurtransferase [Enterococcus sp. PFB1-1]MDH6402249.1 NADPH-dependent 2,4-dienoyl-CoA reductase/sulfur reductase-like enzyme/rhodanese-related sulfurtransferase [Enterococcus sp. PF1-24]
MKIVIIGGVAGGMSAATRLRRLMEDAEIIVFEKGPFVSFANCGLPYYVSGEIATRESLLVQTPESLKARFNLDVRPFHEVIKINPELKQVEVVKAGEVFTESYDVLILSPGAKPFIPKIAGLAEADNVFTLRNVPDLDKIMANLQMENTKTATVIGAGFIGLEMAENLKKRGLKVTLIEKSPHVLPPLDEEMAAFIQRELVKNQVQVITGQSAVAFENHGKRIILEDGSVLSSDLTILAVGIQPETSLAKAAGIKLGLREGILVDETYQTNVPDIYAVGDAIVVKEQITQSDALISLASPANRQGRQVADVIAGLKRKNKGSLGTAIVRVFDLTAAATGLTERQVQMAKLPYQVVHTTGKDHASYYPEATDITLKLIFNPENGELYGAQGVGAKGVDKRIDILATAIKAELTVADLPELEFTYAPPFGSAKDPVNMLGYAALNLMEGLSENIQWHQLKAALATGKKLLDVRTTEELLAGQFKNSLHIPLNDLRERLNELDKDQSYIISCHSGLRSYVGERILKQAGFKVQNLDGAFALYQTIRPEEIVYVSGN